MTVWLGAAAAAVLLGSPVLAASAGPYDGRWVIDISGSNTIASHNSSKGCAGVRMFIDIKDGRVSANLAREPDSPTDVSNSEASGSAPLIGHVTSDGTITASWESYALAGKLAGGRGEVHVDSECGPRVGTVMRMEN